MYLHPLLIVVPCSLLGKILLSMHHVLSDRLKKALHYLLVCLLDEVLESRVPIKGRDCPQLFLELSEANTKEANPKTSHESYPYSAL